MKSLEGSGVADVESHPGVEGKKVGVALWLERCTSLTSLPEGLDVWGWDLNLERCTSLTSLPEGLEVRGWLSLNRCTSLTSLPEGLEVGGWLDLGGCTSLASLPEGLEVKGSLYLTDCTSLTSLPEGLKVGGRLDLKYCRSLTSLPEGLRVGGELYVEGSGVADVGSHPGVRGKIVGGTGHFRSESEFTDWLNDGEFRDIRDIYDEVEVEGDVTLHDGYSGYSLTSLPKNLKVGGSLDLTGCSSLASLPEGLELRGYLYLKGCTSLTSLPEGLKVRGDLHVDGSGVADVESHPGVRGKIVRS